MVDLLLAEIDRLKAALANAHATGQAIAAPTTASAALDPDSDSVQGRGAGLDLKPRATPPGLAFKPRMPPPAPAADSSPLEEQFESVSALVAAADRSRTVSGVASTTAAQTAYEPKGTSESSDEVNALVESLLKIELPAKRRGKWVSATLSDTERLQMVLAECCDRLKPPGKFDMCKEAPRDVNNLDFSDVVNVFKSSAGSIGVFFVQTRAGCVVVKKAAEDDIHAENFSQELLQAMEIQCPQTKFIKRCACVRGTP